ncbi:MAG: EAL domain-containing protein [Ruminiclostridium sp.]|nr:EAL domain-containing protein [Ruminiclostridium sp.]
MPNVLSQTDYSPVGDISVIALCFVVGVMLMASRIQNNKSFRLIIGMVWITLSAAMTNLVFRIFIGMQPMNEPVIYTMRILTHIFLASMQVLYLLYLREPLWMKTDGYIILLVGATVVSYVPVIIDIIGMIFGFGFYISGSEVHTASLLYPISFGIFLIIVFYLLIRYRSRVTRQVFWGLLGTNLMSLLLTSVQGINRQNSFTSLAYFIPVIGILIMFHANSYDNETGAVNDAFFYREVGMCIEKQIPLLMISCTINDFYKNLSEGNALKSALLQFFKQNIKRGVLYRFPNGKLVLTLRKQSGADFERMVGKMFEDFYERHSKLNLDYKLVMAETDPEIKSAAEYIRLMDYIEGEMKLNETRRVTPEDIKRYKGTQYIINELEDISRKGDLDDERVLVYCQPVFNLITGTYDTAEALMRLRLPETGMVFPDKFIPLAEKHNTIHALSMIILNKTCREIHALLDEGYLLNRISVNFSTIDLRYENFCDEVHKIIESNSIPFDKIAVEITESRTELEFNRMKQQVESLRDLGVKFYLDDFGTGYSNFERIMEIPFDIIKFDRSLLIGSVRSDSSRFMVSTFASMFRQLNYSILFEGVEDDRDERQCVDMHASYLQGYKYSKPIPIADLRKFLRTA